MKNNYFHLMYFNYIFQVKWYKQSRVWPSCQWGTTSAVILQSVLNKQKIGVGCIFLGWFGPSALFKGQKTGQNTKPIAVVTVLQSARHDRSLNSLMRIIIPGDLEVRTLYNLLKLHWSKHSRPIQCRQMKIPKHILGLLLSEVFRGDSRNFHLSRQSNHSKQLKCNLLLWFKQPHLQQHVCSDLGRAKWPDVHIHTHKSFPFNKLLSTCRHFY